MAASPIPGLGWAKLPKTFQLGSNTLAVPVSMHKTARFTIYLFIIPDAMK